ncbi:uncharacterized protein LOC128226308 [Mya arenaria]|uniref:uncharacterized protein LOC128226308 n=1 Tax=Mya arenaria TaxID=6604 RepID=UPI0022E8F22F|nr:uncharacterized protein LOC128226308 [Mya arenaria]
MDDLEQNIIEYKPDVIALTEVKPKHCKTKLEEKDLVLDGYHPPYHNLEAEGRGVCIYVSKQFKVEAFNMGSESVQEVKESVWVSVKVEGNKSIVIGCVYRSPSSESENNRILECLLRRVSDMNIRNLIIMGDFNYPYIDWDNHTTSDNDNSDSDQFIECLRDCFFHQHVKEPTIYRGNQRPSLLDLIFTNEENVIKDLHYRAPLGNSDHCTLTFEYTCKTEIVNSKTKKYRYDKRDYSGMRESLSSIDWNKEMECKSTQEAWNVFSDLLDSAMEDHIPTHTIGNKPKKKRQSYMDKQGMRLLKTKQRVWQIYKETEDDQDYQRYCTARNKLRSYTRCARQNFEESLASEIKTNPKAFWKYTNTKLTVKSGVSDLKDSEGNTHNEDGDKSGLLNSFSCSVFTDEDISTVPVLNDRPSDSELRDIDITEETILKQLLSLKINKSSGPDGFHPRVLKEIAQIITSPLMIIFEKSLESGDLQANGNKAK